MMDTIHTILIAVASALSGGFSGWFFTRRKYNTEVDAGMIQNLQSSLDFYKETIEYNEKRLSALIDKIEKAEARNEELEKEIMKLKDRMFNLMEQVCINLTCTMRKRTFDLFGNENTIKENIQED